jgi:hypothetical protein
MANEPPKTPFDSWHRQCCHPNAPAGGGGPGCFTTAGPLGSGGLGWDSLPHPNSPAGRYLTAQEIRLPTLPERVESVVRTYFLALRLAPGAVYRETGYQLDQIKAGLLPGLLQMLAVLGISVVAGAAAGTAIGFFLGGVGAAPGAVMGAELGLEIGIAVLTWLGLGFLVVTIGQDMGELTGVLMSGIRQAWQAPEHHHPQFEINRAAEDLARAEGILFRLILQGLLAYVLKNGAVSASQAALSTGQTIARGGTRAAADETLAEVSALLRNSKLPEEFVVWIERNWEDLKRNPKLAGNKTGPTVSSQASSPATTPSELKAMRERLGREDVAGRITSGEATSSEQIARDNIASNKTFNSLDELNSLKGTGTNVGDLSGISGSSVQDIIKNIPENASVRKLTPAPGGSQVGLEYKWVDKNGVTNRLRVHDPDPYAGVGSNSAEGWTARWQAGGKYYDPIESSFRHKNVHNSASPHHDPAAANNTHIPIQTPEDGLIRLMKSNGGGS